MKVDIKILDERLNLEGMLPSYATDGSAGIDLRAMTKEDFTLEPGEVKVVSTGFAMSLPFNHLVGKVYARSGLSTKHGILLANGTGIIDSDYRGEIKVVLHNTGKEPYTIKVGERIAQMVITHITQVGFRFVSVLDSSDRGEDGFGSTGTK